MYTFTIHILIETTGIFKDKLQLQFMDEKIKIEDLIQAERQSSLFSGKKVEL